MEKNKKKATWAQLLGYGATNKVKPFITHNPKPSDRTINRVLNGISPDNYGINKIASALHAEQLALNKKLSKALKKLTTKTK